MGGDAARRVLQRLRRPNGLSAPELACGSTPQARRARPSEWRLGRTGPPSALTRRRIAPDYPPYTAWGGGDGEPIMLSGFSYEIGGLFEPMCGIKVERAGRRRRTRAPPVLAEIAEYVGDGIEAGIVHGCAAYTHTKGERGKPRLCPRRPRRPQDRGNPDAPRGRRARRRYFAHRSSNVKLCDVTGWAPTLDGASSTRTTAARQVCRHAHGDGGGRPSRRSRTARATRSTSTSIP